MKIDVFDDMKIVAIWLTNAEKNDAALRESLKPVYDVYKKKKYQVGVFESGEGDLYGLTRDLLLYNRRLSAEREVQRAKLQGTTAE